MSLFDATGKAASPCSVEATGLQKGQVRGLAGQWLKAMPNNKEREDVTLIKSAC
jgi:hypothetical protein